MARKQKDACSILCMHTYMHIYVNIYLYFEEFIIAQIEVKIELIWKQISYRRMTRTNSLRFMIPWHQIILYDRHNSMQVFK